MNGRNTRRPAGKRRSNDTRVVVDVDERICSCDDNTADADRTGDERKGVVGQRLSRSNHGVRACDEVNGDNKQFRCILEILEPTGMISSRLSS